MKSTTLLITISGPDRPGIVHEVASLVHERGGNWEHSRLIHLSGRFVGLLQISVDEEALAELRSDLLAINGLELTIAKGDPQAGERGTLFKVELLGADHPGIVRQIFGAAAGLGLNVESMSTQTEAAADSGTLLFRAEAHFSATTETSRSIVQERLEKIAQDLLVEVSVREPE